MKQDLLCRFIALPLILPLVGNSRFAGIVAQWDFTGQNGAQVETPPAAVSDSTLTGTFVLSDEPSTHPQVRHFADTRKKLSVDPYRPLYHFVGPEGLLNDPNGLCQWQGKYHLFYQLRPPNDKNFHWAHAYSTDLVHWKDLPLAISPSIERQVYSGQTLVEKDRVIAMYHGTESGNFVATADDPLLVQWKKIPGNPVIPLATTDGHGQPVRIFDPDIWKEADGYYALSGTYEDGVRGPGKTAKMVQHLFHSTDLTTWRYLFPMVEGRDWTDPGEDGAVPRFLPITPEKHILFFFSHARAAQYLIGHYDPATHKFTPEIHGRFNFGPWLKGSLHAPGAFIDDSGRLIAIFNMRENMISAALPDHDIPANAWYGTMTIPRHLTLTGGTLRMVPIPELETLRTDHQRIDTLTIPADQTLPLEKITGTSLEIDATFDPATTTAREFGLEVFRSPDGKEKTTITIYRDNTKIGSHHIGIDVSHSTLRPDVGARPPEIAPITLPAGQPIRLRAFLDQSILEVFVNDTQALAIRVYPSRADSQTVAAFARGGSATLTSLDAWRMRSIY